MNFPKSIIAMLVVGLAVILTLSFVPYSLARLSRAGQEAIAVLVPSTQSGEPQNSDVPQPAAPPSFDVAVWYGSREEEPEKHGVLIETLDGRRVLASHNADTAFNPASLIKLTTSLVALKRLGANFRFETRVYTVGTIDSTGTLNGKIYVAGGDPTFGDVAGALVARELRARGVNDATGGVVVSPDFCFNYSESPEDSAGRLVKVMNLKKGETETSRKSNAAKKEKEKASERSKREEKRADAKRLKKGGGKNETGGEASGDESSRSEETRRSEAKNADGANGKSGEQRGNSLVEVAPPGKPLFVLRSYPLRDVLLYMNAHSSNFVAERIGALVGGTEGIERFLVEELKLPQEQVSIERASGREHNRMTPRGLVAVLRALNAEAARQGMKLEDIMPVASDDVGTLRRRLAGTPLEGATVGKTGTLTSEVDGGMASLAGIVYTERAGIIVFAILDQGSHISENRELEDQLLNEVVAAEDLPVNIPHISKDTPRRILPSTSLEISDE